MTPTLETEALDLCSRLHREYLREARAQGPWGRSVPDVNRLHRLERLWHRAADRWRRRHGIAPIYEGEANDPQT